MKPCKNFNKADVFPWQLQTQKRKIKIENMSISMYQMSTKVHCNNTIVKSKLLFRSTFILDLIDLKSVNKVKALYNTEITILTPIKDPSMKI